LLFLDFTGGIHRYAGWMAKIQFLPAALALNVIVVAVLLLLTLLLGRIYCSVICPLGIFQDIIARIGRRGKKRPYSYSKELKWLRYPILAVFIIALIAGVGSLVALLAPYSSWGRIVSNLLQPFYIWGSNLLAEIEYEYDSYIFATADVWIRSLPTFIIAVVSAVVIGILAWRNGRTYCNSVCPVGTFLSFFARFSVFRVMFDTDKCKKCSKCSTHCKAACIDYKNMTVDHSRCVVCGDCLGQCDFNALHYTLALGKKAPEATDTPASAGERRSHTSGTKDTPITGVQGGQDKMHDEQGKTQGKEQDKATEQGKQGIDGGRRAFLVGAATMVSASALAQAKKEVEGGFANLTKKESPKRQTPITPPGSISASNMAHHCTGCQLCVSACPNQVLRPSSGLFTMMQPVMGYDHGFCRPECTRCSQVCPAGAIHPISKAEKSSIQIGHAVWVKENCLPVSEGVSCGNCSRHCPTGAIQLVPYERGEDDEVDVPAVNTAMCIGCGACEYVCPSRPFAAIYVEGHEAHKTI